jgi:hypothetical protein
MWTRRVKPMKDVQCTGLTIISASVADGKFNPDSNFSIPDPNFSIPDPGSKRHRINKKIEAFLSELIVTKRLEI